MLSLLALTVYSVLWWVFLSSYWVEADVLVGVGTDHRPIRELDNKCADLHCGCSVPCFWFHCPFAALRTQRKGLTVILFCILRQQNHYHHPLQQPLPLRTNRYTLVLLPFCCFLVILSVNIYIHDRF